jgi:galactokinase
MCVVPCDVVRACAQFTRTELAEAARKCELYIGTMGGGMDQAISCLAEVGKAQHIEFDPLRAHPVTIPAGGVIVVANSLVEASKVRLPSCMACQQEHNFRVRGHCCRQWMLPLVSTAV